MGDAVLRLLDDAPVDTFDEVEVEAEKPGSLGLAPTDIMILEEELDLRKRITGRVDTLRNTILSFVAEHRWDLALRELRLYAKIKSDVEVYSKLSSPHFQAAAQHIKEIRGELTGLDLRSLPTAKRQEIYERVTAYFDGLKMALNRLEAVENDLKVKDLRATIWVLEALTVGVFIVVVAGAGLEAYRTMDRPTTVIFNDIANFVLSLFGLA